MTTQTCSDPILNAEVCPYCGNKPELVDSAEIYGISFGNAYLCRPCDAYVGCHKKSIIPLGRLANRELRKAKMNAHFYFDSLWLKKMSAGFTKHEARSAAYKWLSRQMGTPPEQTHIGMFDVVQCNRVAELCKPYC